MALPPEQKRASDLDLAHPPETDDVLIVTQKRGTGRRESRKLTFGQVVAKVGSLGGAPVTSVNGYQGVVVLTVNDIPGTATLIDQKCADVAEDILSAVSNRDDVLDGGNF